MRLSTVAAVAFFVAVFASGAAVVALVADRQFVAAALSTAAVAAFVFEAFVVFVTR